MRRKPVSPIKVELVNKEKRLIERISSYVPLFISVLAITVSIYSAYETRHHNRLSKKPFVSFKRMMAADGDEVGLIIENNGLGPAVISNFSIFLDTNQIIGDGINDWESVTEKLNNLFKNRSPKWNYLHEGYLLKAGDSIALYATSPENIIDLEQFRDVLINRLIVKVRACSLYQECEDVCFQKIEKCSEIFLGK